MPGPQAKLSSKSKQKRAPFARSAAPHPGTEEGVERRGQAPRGERAARPGERRPRLEGSRPDGQAPRGERAARPGERRPRLEGEAEGRAGKRPSKDDDAGARTPPLETVAGLAAARAVLNVRPHDVRHIAYSPEARMQLAELLRSAAQQRIAYREVPAAELDKLAGTLHHEGISVQVKARPALAVDGVIRALEAGGFALALDRVRNPHNIGALLRSAAYFGASALLVGGDGEELRLTPAAVRTAEGGAEHVPVCFAPELCDALDRLARAGAQIVGADAHGGEDLARVRFDARCVLVLGNERSGLAPAVRRRCAGLVRIPGSGRVDSLNVSVAAGILLAHAAAERTR
jgi:TrmH RNA methyltransferase